MPVSRLFADTTTRRQLGLLVVAVAVVVRASACTELRNSALLHLERWPDSEMHYVDAQARAVTGGDQLLPRAITTPGAGFLCTPHAAWQPQAARCADPAEAAMLRRWTLTAAYWEAPLYTYFVAAVYALAGPDPRIVFALQALLGVISCWLAFMVAARLFGDTAAAAAGLLAALLGTGVYYENMLVGSTCTGVAALATLYALLRALESERPFAAAWSAGIAGATTALLSATALPAVAVTFATALWIRITHRDQRRGKAAAALVAGLVCGAALMWSPLLARNLAVGAPPWSLAARTPVDFVMGNASGATATETVRPNAATTAVFAQPGDGLSAGAPLDVSTLIAATIATHPSNADWLWLVAAKFAGFWRWFEIPSDANYCYFIEHLPLVSRFLVAWSVLAGLVVLGLLSGSSKAPAILLPTVWIMATAAACALLSNSSQARFPAALIVTPLAGQGIATLLRLYTERRYILGWAALAFTIAVGYATLADWEVPFGHVTPWYCDIVNNIAIAVAEEQQAQGHTERALATVTKQLCTEPRALRAVPPGAELALDSWIAVSAQSFETICRSQARYSAMLGDDAGAREASQHAERLGAIVEQWKSWPGD